MTAITATRAEAAQNGIEPFEARKHLRQVAELIAAVFASELDAEGRRAVEEKETIGRWGPLLGGILSTALFADFISGYVWMENGQVVGNVTLQRQEDSGTRWRISNVAVTSAYRGRGIARTLMQATLREIARRGGSWAVLQVRVDNPTARRLYEKLGFAGVCTEGLWYAPGIPRLKGPGQAPLPPKAPLQPLGGRDWRARFELAQASRAPLAHWAEPIDPASFRTGLFGSLRQAVGEATGLRRVRRWGAWSETEPGVLLGEVEVTFNGVGENHRLRLAVRPDAPEGTVAALLAQGQSALTEAAGFAGGRGVVAEYSGEMAEPGRALEAAGFRPRRILLTMRRLITPPDAAMPVPGLD